MKVMIDSELLFEIYEFMNDSNIANTFMKHKSKELGLKLKKYVERGDVCDNFISESQSDTTGEQNT